MIIEYGILWNPLVGIVRYKTLAREKIQFSLWLRNQVLTFTGFDEKEKIIYVHYLFINDDGLFNIIHAHYLSAHPMSELTFVVIQNGFTFMSLLRCNESLVLAET
jgi:hypothetical protein